MTSEYIDYIGEAIKDSLGDRCAEHADNCPTCEAWKQYDGLKTENAQLREYITARREYDRAVAPNSGFDHPKRIPINDPIAVRMINARDAIKDYMCEDS